MNGFITFDRITNICIFIVVLLQILFQVSNRFSMYKIQTMTTVMINHTWGGSGRTPNCMTVPDGTFYLTYHCHCNRKLSSIRYAFLNDFASVTNANPLIHTDRSLHKLPAFRQSLFHKLEHKFVFFDTVSDKPLFLQCEGHRLALKYSSCVGTMCQWVSYVRSFNCSREAPKKCPEHATLSFCLWVLHDKAHYLLTNKRTPCFNALCFRAWLTVEQERDEPCSVCHSAHIQHPEKDTLWKLPVLSTCPVFQFP